MYITNVLLDFMQHNLLFFLGWLQSSCTTPNGRFKKSLYPRTFHKVLQNHPKGSVTPLVTFADFSQNCPLPIHYIVIRYPQQIVQMAFRDGGNRLDRSFGVI